MSSMKMFNKLSLYFVSDTQKLTPGDAIPEPSTFFFTEDDPRLKGNY